MSATTAAPVIEVTLNEIEDILRQASERPLDADEREKLRALAVSNLAVLSEIEDGKATIGRLRRMVFGAKTETKANVTGQSEKAPTEGSEKKPPKKKRKRKGHGRIPACAYVGAEKVKVAHESLRPGDRCLLCPGTVYDEKQKPAVSVRIRGSAPFVATVFEQQRLRCGLCGEVFTAKLPAEAGTGKKFDETAASMVALLRYGNGLPMHRIENLQKVMGMPFPASTQWELVSEAAKKIAAAQTELIRQAAQGAILYNDDTPMKILEFMIEQRERKERGEKPPERTGTFTSGIVSELSDGRKIVLYSVTERLLKRAILHRKNSLFYKTQNGAAVGDLYMSLIAMAKLAQADPFDYLNQLQRHAEEVTDDPAAWMPWNYRETIASTTGVS